MAFREFDVREGCDDAALLVSAVLSLDADVDPYVQRQNADLKLTYLDSAGEAG